MTIAPSQYPDGIHQRYLAYTGITHTRLVEAFDALALCNILTITGSILAIASNAFIWLVIKDELPPIFSKPLLTAIIIGLVFLAWYKCRPSPQDRLLVKNYRLIGIVLEQVSKHGIKTNQCLAVLMDQYQVNKNSNYLDAREQIELSEGIHILLCGIASEIMALELENTRPRLIQRWRTGFEDVFMVAVMLRLIPQWYQATCRSHSSPPVIDTTAWDIYFDRKEFAEGLPSPVLNWDNTPMHP